MKGFFFFLFFFFQNRRDLFSADGENVWMGSMATWKKGGTVGEDDCEMCYKHKTNPENKWKKKILEERL